MPFALRGPLGGKMQTKRSSWTPLNHHLSNSQVFEERRNLVGKWFDKWSDSQRKQVLQDFFSRCSAAQMKNLRQTLSAQVPEEALDLTTVLPRVVSLYIFSFLDPRSLCRCAQVSWPWKNLAELDQLWMPKCLRLGWCIAFTPTPFEQGVWKRHYVETVQGLHVITPRALGKEESIVPEAKAMGSEIEKPTAESGESRPGVLSQNGRGYPGHASPSSAKGLPPWRDSDRHPTDTIRFNYLDNLDPIEHARQVQARSRRTHLDPSPDGTLRKALSASSYKRCKAKSMMFSSMDLGAGSESRQSRPQWASPSAAPFSAKDPLNKVSLSQWNAGIRPGPVTNPIPRLTEKSLRASLRSHRSTPTVLLFEGPTNLVNPNLR